MKNARNVFLETHGRKKMPRDDGIIFCARCYSAYIISGEPMKNWEGKLVEPCTCLDCGNTWEEEVEEEDAS